MIQSVATTIVTGEHTTKPSATLEWSAWEAERGGNGREVMMHLAVLLRA
jgi:hypothetical protein